MTDAPRRPFWRRKRWIAAAILWLVVAYPVGLSTACYLAGRRLLPIKPVLWAYIPVSLTIGNGPGEWLFELGTRHAYASSL